MQSDSLAHFKADAARGDERDLFGRVPAIAHDEYAQLLPSSAWEVYTQIVTKAWKREEGFKAEMSQAELKVKTGLDEKTIRKGLALLVRIGLLDLVRKSAQGRAKTYRWTQGTELLTEVRRQQLEGFKLQFRMAGELPPEMPLYPASEPQEAERPPLRLHQGKLPGLDRENFPDEPGKLPGLDRENFPGEPGKLPGLDRENFPVPLIEREERDQSSSRAEAAAASKDECDRIQRASKALSEWITDPAVVEKAMAQDWRLVEAVTVYMRWRVSQQRMKPIGGGFVPGILRSPAAYGFHREESGSWSLPLEYPSPKKAKAAVSLAGAWKDRDAANRDSELGEAERQRDELQRLGWEGLSEDERQTIDAAVRNRYPSLAKARESDWRLQRCRYNEMERRRSMESGP